MQELQRFIPEILVVRAEVYFAVPRVERNVEAIESALDERGSEVRFGEGSVGNQCARQSRVSNRLDDFRQIGVGDRIAFSRELHEVGTSVGEFAYDPTYRFEIHFGSSADVLPPGRNRSFLEDPVGRLIASFFVDRPQKSVP